MNDKCTAIIKTTILDDNSESVEFNLKFSTDDLITHLQLLERFHEVLLDYK